MLKNLLSLLMMIKFKEHEEEQGKILLNRLAREKMKLKLLSDINCDLMICELESWDKKQFLSELKELIDSLIKQQP